MTDINHPVLSKPHYNPVGNENHRSPPVLISGTGLGDILISGTGTGSGQEQSAQH